MTVWKEGKTGTEKKGCKIAKKEGAKKREYILLSAWDTGYR